MKYSLLALLTLAIGCGKYDVRGTSSSGIGEVRSVANVIAAPGTTVQSVQAVCNALGVKEAALASSVGTLHTFTASQTDCDGNSTLNGTFQVAIQRNGQDYVFTRTDGLGFVFPEVETRTAGIFSDICAQGTGLTVPLLTGTEATFVSTTGFAGSECSPIPGEETCLVIERGPVQNNSAIITSRDIIRIRTGGTRGKIGFFTQRKRVSQAFCSNNRAVTATATLK